MATKDYDSVEYLINEDSIAAYLQTAAGQNDEEFYVECLDKVMRARAINQIAETTGIDRNRIYQMFSDPVLVAKVQAAFSVAAPRKELVQL